MNYANRIRSTLGLLLLPLLCEAHPGHEGGHTLSPSDVILFAAALYALVRLAILASNALRPHRGPARN